MKPVYMYACNRVFPKRPVSHPRLPSCMRQSGSPELPLTFYSEDSKPSLSPTYPVASPYLPHHSFDSRTQDLFLPTAPCPNVYSHRHPRLPHRSTSTVSPRGTAAAALHPCTSGSPRGRACGNLQSGWASLSGHAVLAEQPSRGVCSAAPAADYAAPSVATSSSAGVVRDSKCPPGAAAGYERGRSDTTVRMPSVASRLESGGSAVEAAEDGRLEPTWGGIG